MNDVSAKSPPRMAPVGIVQADEPWMEITLADGFKVRLRVIVTGVFRVEGQFDPNGNPLYSLSYQLVTGVERPPMQ